jgi:hypothetical protein
MSLSVKLITFYSSAIAQFRPLKFVQLKGNLIVLRLRNAAPTVRVPSNNNQGTDAPVVVKLGRWRISRRKAATVLSLL